MSDIILFMLKKKISDKKCVCEWCLKEFETRHDYQGRFCSNQCRSEFASKQPRPNNKRPDTMKIERACGICEEKFFTTIHQIKHRNGGKYCSRKCSDKASSLRMLNNGGPNYKGGITQNRLYFRGRNWDIQRRKVLKRDNKTCKNCHKKKEGFLSIIRIDVHHIIPYRLFNGDFEAANKESNLITLCHSCHIKVESGKMPCPAI